MLYDEKESNLNHGHLDSVNFPDDNPLLPSEFLSESPLTAADLSSDFDLGLHENEPDSWTTRVGKEVARKLKENEVKRQEHIYEFILTEKRHCITLLGVQKVFVEGLQKHFQMGTSLDRMFPRLANLIELHLQFLARLRRRQKESTVVLTIADILEEQFSNHNAQKLKSAYGEFCSKHREAVEIYKDYLQSNPRFEQFVRHCQSNPLLKKKGIPECILFITQRLTKYPLLIEPLIKTSKENKTEQETLQRTFNFVKDILVDVDAQVAQKEKEDRKLEIYHKIDDKSYTMYRGLKFRKSDILQSYRTLKFEGSAMLRQGRSKMQPVLVIVLSDILFFLQESSQKYVFFTPENKAGVISLQNLLVREKAGQDSRGIYLISSNPADPGMFELKVHKPKDKHIWIHAISFQAQLNDFEAGGDGSKLYNQQLEELRNFQQKLTAEKSAWITVRDQEAKELEDKRKELLQLQEQIKREEDDVKLQREHLFRTMEKLTNKGIIIIPPNVATSSLSGQPDENCGKETTEHSLRGDSSGMITSLGNMAINAQAAAERKKEKWNKNSQPKSQLPPITLISATNEQKVANVQVKQQIPLKLASRFSSSGSPNIMMGTSTSTQLLPLKLSQDDK